MPIQNQSKEANTAHVPKVKKETNTFLIVLNQTIYNHRFSGFSLAQVQCSRSEAENFNCT